MAAAQSTGATGGIDAGAVPPAPWWLPGPHLPTVWGKMVRDVPMPPTRRERWDLPDGDVLSVERLDAPPGAPRLVLFHGLEGSTRSSYARALVWAARARGWGADFVLWRTCDGQVVNRVPRAYHSGASDDADVVIRRVAAEDPDRPLVLVGVSLGGNVLCKWLGEQGSDAPAQVRAAAAVSVPFDLARCSRQIEQGFARVYGRFFVKTLKAKTAAKLQRFPGLVDAEALAAVRTIWQFDDVVTAPVHGFSDAADYYARCSALRFLPDVRVPTLLLNAADDPFLPREILDEVRAVAAVNPALHCQFPSYGGHVGFVAGPLPWRATYWMEELVVAWMARRLQP
jgi:predicted alpha/beta-fold hydrolase